MTLNLFKVAYINVYRIKSGFEIIQISINMKAIISKKNIFKEYNIWILKPPRNF